MNLRTLLNRMPWPQRAGHDLRVVLVTTGMLVVLGACNLLDVTNPDIVPTGGLATANTLPTIRAGAIGDFNLAYGGSGAQGSNGAEGQVMVSATLTDEIENTETFPDRVHADARLVDNTSATYQTVFNNLSRARASTEGAAAKFKALLSATDLQGNSGMSELLSLAGFTYIMFAENYCSGVPFSGFDPNTNKVIYGQPLNTTQMLDTALDRFNQALAAANNLTSASSKTQFSNLANLGIARANLDLGNFATASAAVAAVATGFVYQTNYDLNTIRENNGVFTGTANYKRYGMTDKKGGVGLPWISVPDPRTPIFRAKKSNGNPDFGFDGTTPQFNQLRYVDQKASIPLATGLEARLIEAEAALQIGDSATFLAKLNGVRTAPPGYILAGDPTNTSTPPLALTNTALPPLAAPAGAAAAISLLFTERGRWLWLTGHRLSDLRREVRQYGMAINAVFPNGAYFKQGLTYGNDVNFPVPFAETNNPNFTACFDRNP